MAVSRAGIAEHLALAWPDGAEDFPDFMKRGAAEKGEILIAIAPQQSWQLIRTLLVNRLDLQRAFESQIRSFRRARVKLADDGRARTAFARHILQLMRRS